MTSPEDARAEAQARLLLSLLGVKRTPECLAETIGMLGLFILAKANGV